MKHLLIKELYTWLYSPVLYAFVIVFSCLSVFMMMVVNDFIAIGQSDLSSPFFQWHPWIFALIVPVIAISSWADETENGVFEVLITQPVSILAIILSKFIPGAAVILMALVASCSALFFAMLFGDADVGASISAYLASFLSALVFLSFSFCICTTMKGSIASYVLAVGLCLVLVLIGSDAVIDAVASNLPQFPALAGYISSFSVFEKVQVFSSGRLSLVSIFELSVMVCVGITLTHRSILKWRMPLRKSWLERHFKYGISKAFIVIAALAVFVVSSGRDFVVDLSDDKAFSLTPEQKASIQRIEKPITVTLYVSESNPAFGFDLYQMRQAVEHSLSYMQGLNDQISVKFVNTSESAVNAEKAAINGIEKFVFDSGNPLFFGLTLESGAKRRVFSFLDPQRQALILADIYKSVEDVSFKARLRVGLYNMLSRGANPNTAGYVWAPIEVLGPRYDLVDLTNAAPELAELDVLLLLQPGEMSVQWNTAIKHFVESGGKVIAFVDPYAFFYEKYDGFNELVTYGSTPAFIRDYGVEFAERQLVADHKLATRVQKSNEVVIDPFVLTLTTEQLASSGFMAGMNSIEMLYSGYFTVRSNSGASVTPLLWTSEGSELIDIKNDGIAKISNGETLGLKLTVDKQCDERCGEVLLIADVDWLHSDIANSTGGGNDFYDGNANALLVSNMINAMAGIPYVNDLMVKARVQRPLFKWKEALNTYVSEYNQQLAAYEAEYSRLIADQREISKKLEVSAQHYDPELMQQLHRLEEQARSQLTKIGLVNSQRELNINKRESFYRWLVVLLVPCCVFLLGFFVLLIRAKRTG